MAAFIKKLMATPESRSTLMLTGGILVFLDALGVAVLVMTHWKDTGVIMGRSLPVALVASAGGIALATACGIWSLAAVNRFEGKSSTKCTIGYLLDAAALAILGAFLLIIMSLRVSVGG